MPLLNGSSILLYEGGVWMNVLIISKSTFQTHTYQGVSNVAYAAATDTYTLTLAGGSTQTISGSIYYLSLLW